MVAILQVVSQAFQPCSVCLVFISMCAHIPSVKKYLLMEKGVVMGVTLHATLCKHIRYLLRTSHLESTSSSYSINTGWRDRIKRELHMATSETY